MSSASGQPHPRGDRFASRAQQRFFFANYPQGAKETAEKMKCRSKKGSYRREHPIKAANLPEHVGKGLRLRRVKVPQPILRHGVTRAGRVGVEYVHEGVKGWGLNETAARASWQSNRAMRIGKRAQDGSGNATGRKFTEAANPRSKKAVVKPNAMPSIASAPEPLAPVGKAAPGSWKTIDQRQQSQYRARRYKRRGIAAATTGLGLATVALQRNPKALSNAARVARRATKDAYPVREGPHYFMVRFGEPNESNLKTLPRRAQYVGRAARGDHGNTGLAGGGAALFGAGTATAVGARGVESYQQRRINARRKTNAQRGIGKAARYYDPEDRRQRRRGLTAGGLATSGGYLTVTGAREAARHVKAQNNPQTRGALEHLSQHFPPGTDKRARALVNAVAGRKATVIHHGTSGRILLGAGLLGAGASVVRRSDDPRRRRWS